MGSTIPTISSLPTSSASPSISAVPSVSTEPSSFPSSGCTSDWNSCPDYFKDFGWVYSNLDDCCNEWYGTDLDQCTRKGGRPLPGGGWYANWQKYYCVENCQ